MGYNSRKDYGGSMKSAELNISNAKELDHASSLLKFSRFPEACAVARQIVVKDPKHVGALEILVKALWQCGQHDEVLLVLRRLIVLNPYEPGYRALQGAALQCLGRYGEAARAFAQSSQLPSSQEALQELRSWQAGLVQEMLGTDPVFRAHYEQDPKDACLCRGFDFVEDERQMDRWLTVTQNRAELYIRPS